MKFLKLNFFDIILLVFSTVIAISISWFSKHTLLGFTAFLSGVLCVIYAAKGNILTFYFGIYNALSYSFVSFQNNLYGETLLNLCFFLPINIIGLFMWKKHINNEKTDNEKIVVKNMATQYLISLIFFCIVSAYFYGLVLSSINGQNTPFIDSFNTCASIIATFLMIFRFKENWIINFIINISTIIVWSIRLLHGSDEAGTMLVMWSTYLINCIYGYYMWNKDEKTEKLSIDVMELDS